MYKAVEQKGGVAGEAELNARIAKTRDLSAVAELFDKAAVFGVGISGTSNACEGPATMVWNLQEENKIARDPSTILNGPYTVKHSNYIMIGQFVRVEFTKPDTEPILEKRNAPVSLKEFNPAANDEPAYFIDIHDRCVGRGHRTGLGVIEIIVGKETWEKYVKLLSEDRGYAYSITQVAVNRMPGQFTDYDAENLNIFRKGFGPLYVSYEGLQMMPVVESDTAIQTPNERRELPHLKERLVAIMTGRQKEFMSIGGWLRNAIPEINTEEGKRNCAVIIEDCLKKADDFGKKVILYRLGQAGFFGNILQADSMILANAILNGIGSDKGVTKKDLLDFSEAHSYLHTTGRLKNAWLLDMPVLDNEKMKTRLEAVDRAILENY